MESSAFLERVHFPTGFASRGTSQRFKEVGAPLATEVAGVRKGVDEVVSLKICSRIENSRDIAVDLTPEP